MTYDTKYVTIISLSQYEGVIVVMIQSELKKLRRDFQSAVGSCRIEGFNNKEIQDKVWKKLVSGKTAKQIVQEAIADGLKEYDKIKITKNII